MPLLKFAGVQLALVISNSGSLAGNFDKVTLPAARNVVYEMCHPAGNDDRSVDRDVAKVIS